MLGKEPDKYEIKYFVELLLQYAQEEKLNDNNRCLLAQDLYFDVCSLYNYILYNFSEKNNISENIIIFSAIKKFLQIDLNISINDEILSKFFDFYSSKNNIDNITNERYLEYIQFVDIFYPRYNLQLRRFLQQRNGLNNYIKKLDNITKSILQKLFIGEINKIKNMHFSLNKFINFDSGEIFKIISNNKKFITKVDLIYFFNLYNQDKINYTEEDINSIIYSLSLNRKYNNDKKEYIEGITEEDFINIFNINKNKNFILSISFKDNIFNEQKDKNLLFFNLITKIIEQEKKIEEAKISIISRHDFDINRIINYLFNIDDKIEYNYFLDNFNLSLNDAEKDILFRRIDLTHKGYIDKADFFDFFVPFDMIYRKKIKKNILENSNNENINNTNVNYINLNLSKGTIIYIQNLVNVVIKGEKEINTKKIELNGEDKFIENIFDEIVNMPDDNNNKDNSEENPEEKEINYLDYFNKEKLYKYLTVKLNIKISDDELKLFFIRLDKLRRGKIKLLEFSDEMKYINI